MRTKLLRLYEYIYFYVDDDDHLQILRSSYGMLPSRICATATAALGRTVATQTPLASAAPGEDVTNAPARPDIKATAIRENAKVPIFKMPSLYF